MKKILLGVSVLISALGTAQNMVQAPLTDNNFLINPAVAGFQHDLNAFAGYRNAYTGLEGNPTSSILATDFKLKGKFGAGVIVGAEQIGVFKNHGIQLAGSYGLQVADEAYLSFGIQGGAFFNSVDMQALNVESMSDIAITESLQNGSAFNFGMGAHLNFKRFDLGVSSGRLLASGYKFENENLTVNQAPDFVGYGSYEIKASEVFNLKPIIGVQGVQNTPVIINSNLMIQNVKDGYQFGYGYNTNQSHSVMFGIEIKKHLNLNYAFSFGGNGVMQGTNGTHEIGIGFLIKDFKDLEGNQAEIDSLLALTDSLSSKIKVLEKQKADLVEKYQVAKAKNEQIDELKSKIEQKDQMIKALRDKLKNNSSEPTNSGASSSSIQNGEILQKGTFYLVVESFKTEKRAQKAVSNWKEQGIEVYYVKNDKGTWFYVVTAKYSNKKAAQNALAGMRGTLIKDAWIYKH